jgi:hypothetical protein
MLETIVAYAMMAMPYLLIGVGVLGVFLLLARLTVKFAAPAARG